MPKESRLPDFKFPVSNDSLGGHNCKDLTDVQLIK